MKKTKEIWALIFYGMKTAFSFSKSRVFCSIITKVIDYFLWVFYSAYFVRFVLDTIQNERPFREILVNIGMIGGISLCLQAFRYFSMHVVYPMQDVRICQGMYKKIYRKSEDMELACFEEPVFYNKFSIALDDIGGKLSENIDNVGEIIGGTIGGILAAWAMIEIDPRTVLFLIAPLLGNFFFAPKMNRISYSRYKDSVPYDRRIAYVNRVMYLEKYAKELRLYPVFHVIRKMFCEATMKKSGVWKKYFPKAFGYGMLQYIFSYVVIFEGILLYGAYRAIVTPQGGITFSQMAVLTSVMVTASWVWVRVIRAYNRCSEIALVMADVREFLEYESRLEETPDAISPKEEIESIEFCGVSFAYDGGQKVIDNLSFRVAKGEKIAMAGHNGAGKSTILKLLLRLYDPTEGTILLNGVDIRKYKLEEYRSLFGCAFQDYRIFAGSVKENVLMGREGTEEQVAEALRMAGIYQKVMSLPEGIDTVLTREFDEKGALLSGGEEQKIVCARVFAGAGKVCLFDEPSGALDPISENELFQSILQALAGKIGILVSHRLSSVKNADNVLMLQQGRLVEQGTHSELMALRGVYYEMYKVQERNYFTYDTEKAERIGEGI